MAQKLWAANPHEYGPGKVHVIDDENPLKTMCGRFTAAIPGSAHASGNATCRICLNSVAARPERKAQEARWAEERVRYEAQREEQERAREQQNAEWWQRYNAYLQTSEWRRRRALVLKRANGICEGCMEHPATQVHHLSYAHVGAEFLWELRAICNACHEKAHGE